jgi:hypothetical protein
MPSTQCMGISTSGSTGTAAMTCSILVSAGLAMAPQSSRIPPSSSTPLQPGLVGVFFLNLGSLHA